MENDTPTPDTSEQNELVSHTYQVCFDDEHFDGVAMPVDTWALVEALNHWWDTLCTQNSLDPRDEKIEIIGYHMIELGKNVLEHGRGGAINIIFEPHRIRVVAIDNKGWKGNPNDDILFGSPGHGLSGITGFADEFIIETNGIKYTKEPGKKKLGASQDTLVIQGSKITFMKILG